jgi:hypothetical protein
MMNFMIFYWKPMMVLKPVESHSKKFKKKLMLVMGRIQNDHALIDPTTQHSLKQM